MGVFLYLFCYLFRFFCVYVSGQIGGYHRVFVWKILFIIEMKVIHSAGSMEYVLDWKRMYSYLFGVFLKKLN